MVLEGMKKQQLQKRTRVPKRGPGFVELEKILRKEKTHVDITTSSSSSTTTNPSASLKSHHQTSMPSSQGAASSNFPGMDHRSQSNTGNQKRKNQYLPPPPPPLPPLMQMNHFGGTSSQVCSGLLSNRLHTHQEPPSIQTSFHHYTPWMPEEHKRVPTSFLDNYLIPPPKFQGVPSFSHYNMPHQLSTNDNHAVGTYNSTNEGYSLEVSSRRFNSDIVGAGHANFQPFSTPEVTPPPTHLFQGALYQVTQDKMQNSYQRSKSSVPDPKPFYNFLEVKDQKGLTNATQCSNQEGREEGKCDIDLSLKL